jgi:acyl carrier protein
MGETFTTLVERMREIFPKMEEMELASETRLEEIPEWDSMSAVNLETCIEGEFGVIIPQIALGGELTIGELVGYIDNPDTIPMQEEAV